MIVLKALLLIAAFSSSPVSPLLEKLRETAYMTGSFRQSDMWALTLEEETSCGTMHLARPRLFRLSYSDPDGRATGYDGSVLYTVEPDLGQVILYPSREPDSFLHLLEQCADSTLQRTVESTGDSLFVSLRGDFGQGISFIEVGFTVSDSLPFTFSTTDYNGNTTTYDLWDITTSEQVPQGVFDLEVPQGFEVIDPEGA